MRIRSLTTTSLLAAALIGGAILTASPAEAATTTGTASATTSKADKTFIKYMMSWENVDRALYRGKPVRKMHNLGVAVCGLIKVYDRTETAEDAVSDAMAAIWDSHDYPGSPYTHQGDAQLVIASIHGYCTQYVRWA